MQINNINNIEKNVLTHEISSSYAPWHTCSLSFLLSSLNLANFKKMAEYRANLEEEFPEPDYRTTTDNTGAIAKRKITTFQTTEK